MSKSAPPSKTIRAGEAARILGLTPQMVRRLDADLEPQRSVGGWREFDRDRVERLAAEREARRKNR